MSHFHANKGENLDLGLQLWIPQFKRHMTNIGHNQRKGRGKAAETKAEGRY